MRFTQDFITAGRRKQLLPVLEKLFADKSLVSTAMAEDLLKFKRIDGAVGAGDDRDRELRRRPPEGGVGRTARRARQSAGAGDLGRLDQIIPASHAVGLPENVKTHVLPGAGHMPHMEKAAEVNRILLDFIPK